MQAMAYDDDETPELLAQASKDKGNKAFRKGKAFHGNALRHYKEALDHCMGCRVQTEEMEKLQSTVRSNLAAILLAREKYGEVVFECKLALELWPGNVKAAFRGAKACVALGKFEDAVKLCDEGLKAEADNTVCRRCCRLSMRVVRHAV